MRCFFALPLAEESRAELVSVQERLRRKARRSSLNPRWIDEAGLHVTLKFLGYVDRENIDTLTGALARHATTIPMIETNWQGLVAFASPRRARIIAASLSDTAGSMARLAECCETAAEALGIPRERRAFHPHVTLCRIKQPGDVSGWLLGVELSKLPLRFEEVILYESRLRPTGAIYSPIARVALA